MKVCSISVWCMVMAMIVGLVAADSVRPTWNIAYGSEELYSSFLEILREALGAGTPKVCNISVTNSANKKSYVLVDLVLPFNGDVITLALRGSDAYLVGFQDTNSETKKLRANFFSDEYAALSVNYTSIFKEAVNESMLPCASTYTDLERKAGNRGNISLGVVSLQSAFKEVYGKNFNQKKSGKDMGKVVAKFALISIQMVVEAARFKFIENQVIVNGTAGLTFLGGNRTTFLENNWSKISQKYYKSCNVTDEDFTEQEMDLGLLLHNK